jgi:hypothetical protein
MRAAMLLVVAVNVQDKATSPTTADLNPDRAHIQILLPDLDERREAPHVALYTSPALGGAPAIELTGDGLFVNGALVCSWPGGHFENERSYLMVLGYVDRDATDYRGCPAGLPIKSVWEYADGKDAALFIEIAARNGSLIETRWGGKKYYFDLNALQGDPAVRGEAIDPVLTRVVRPKGYTAWAWIEPRRDTERRAAAALASVRREESFTTFVRDVKACLSSAATPGCLARFVKPEFYYAELWAKTNRPHAAPAEFVDFVWHQRDQSGGRMWNRLVACFTTGTLTDASKNAVRFQTDNDFCDIERTSSGWKLVSFNGRP